MVHPRVIDKVLALIAHQLVARLLREVFLHRHVHPNVFDGTGYDQLQPAAKPGAGAGDKPRVAFERTGRVDAHALTKKVNFELTGIE